MLAHTDLICEKSARTILTSSVTLGSRRAIRPLYDGIQFSSSYMTLLQGVRDESVDQ